MMAAVSLRTIVLSGVSFHLPSLCRRACSANAFALHLALLLGLHSEQQSGVPMAAFLAADSLRIAVQPVVLSGVSLRSLWPRRRAWRACAFARHTAQHPALRFMRPPNVQASCLERGWPSAIAVFDGALIAPAAAPPGRSYRERELGVQGQANAEGKIEGCGTTVRAMPVCTWVGGGTRPSAAACRQWPYCLAGIGSAVCRIRSGAMGLAGASS